MNGLEQDYDTFAKDLAWTTFWQGYKGGRGVESYKKITKRTARSQFERWWELNA
jgi:hypothetical protein